MAKTSPANKSNQIKAIRQSCIFSLRFQLHSAARARAQRQASLPARNKKDSRAPNLLIVLRVSQFGLLGNTVCLCPAWPGICTRLHTHLAQLACLDSRAARQPCNRCSAAGDNSCPSKSRQRNAPIRLPVASRTWISPSPAVGRLVELAVRSA